MSLDITSLEKAVTQLENTLGAHDSKLMQENPEYKIYMRGAVIQAFEYTYALSLRMIRRYLEMSSDVDGAVDDMTFSDVIREAHARGIILSDLQNWKMYRKKRGITSHTYDEDKAQDVFSSIPSFLDEVRYVLARLQELNESLDSPD